MINENEEWRSRQESEGWRPRQESEGWRPRQERREWRPRQEGEGWRPRQEGEGWRPRQEGEGWRSHQENELLFSRSIKAGKRMYYIDVKKDRRDEFYISMTESKRVQDGTLEERPVFEKHKIFLYREDILNFVAALTDAATFVGKHRSLTPHERQYMLPEERPSEDAPLTAPSDKIELGGDFEVEF